MGKQWETLCFGAPKSLQMVTAAMKLKGTPWKKSYDQPRQHFQKQRHYFANEGPSSQGYSFSSSRVWMWELGYKERWVPKNWCFWTLVLEKTLESPLNCKHKSQLILKKINPEYALEGLMAKLKLPQFGQLMWKAKSLEMTLILGKTEDKRRRGRQSMRWLAGITTLSTWVWSHSRKYGRTGKPSMLQSMGSQRVRHSLATEKQ